MNKRNFLAILFILSIIVIAFFVTRDYSSKPSSTLTTDATGTTSSAATTTPTAAINAVSYSCDGGKMIAAVFHEGTSVPATNTDQPPVPTGTVDLTLDDGTAMTLSQTVSADGARYANADESFVFWSKGTGAIVLQNGQEGEYTGCIGTSL